MKDNKYKNLIEELINDLQDRIEGIYQWIEDLENKDFEDIDNYWKNTMIFNEDIDIEMMLKKIEEQEQEQELGEH